MSANSGSTLYTTRHVHLTTPEGGDLATDTVWFKQTDPPSLGALIPWHSWEQLDTGGGFDLQQASVPADLVPGEPVVVSAVLADGVAFPPDRSRLRRWLADPTHPLRSTASWHATAVKQAQTLPEETTQSAASTDTMPPNAVDSIIEQYQPSPVRSGSNERSVGADADGLDGTAGDRSADIDRDEQPVQSVLEPVAEALTAEGWPYQVAAAGRRLALEATACGHRWTVYVQPLDEECCQITSVLPAAVERADSDRLLAYNGEIRRGGFAVDDGELRFRTPFCPHSESVADALGENVTAVVEQFERE